MTTLIVAHLSDRDYDRLQAAGVPYCGATGKGRRGTHGAYIATSLEELPAVLEAVKWKRVRLTRKKGGRYLVRKGAPVMAERIDPE